ncbi:MAG: 4Fe-4S dicluster domain-containing protein [Clostridiaceae bacterium]
MYLLKKENLNDMLDIWARGFEVYTPQNEAGQVMLLPYEKNNLTMEYITFAFPVKEYLFKEKEQLFDWKREKGDIKIQSPENMPNAKRILFGIRACDLYGIRYMNKFYLEDFKDNIYEKNLKETLIAAVNCDDCGENCFCASMGTGPFSDSGYDVLFTPISDFYLIEVGSDKGEELIALCKELVTNADDSMIVKKEEVKKSFANKFKTVIKTDDIHKVMKAGFNDPLWESIEKDCIRCTGCTNVCPTCTCFNVVEENKSSLHGKRVRCWDSCQSDAFTRNAGEHNPRNSISRVRYRIYDKFKYIEEKFKFKGCSGCGRCIEVCPASIHVVKIINELADKYDKINDKKSAEGDFVFNHIHGERCEDIYVPQVAIIKEIFEEAPKIKRFVLQYEDKTQHENFVFRGQFFEITVFGVGEIAISIPFSPSSKDEFDFCVKKAGKVTSALHKLKVGDKVGLRGPFGKGFPYEEFVGKDIIIVGSGVGIAPVRTMIVRALENRRDFGKIVIIGSAMSYEGLVYKDDLLKWDKTAGVRVLYALSNPTSEVEAHVGYINDLLPDLGLDWGNTCAIICASPRRIKAVSKDLLKLGMKGTDIYTSLETHMRCGIGKCGHCKVGNKYMCVDGPVFNYDEMLELPPEF